MEKLNTEDLSDFQHWLKTKVIVTCPKCVEEFRLPNMSVKFMEDNPSIYGSPFHFDQSPLQIACGTPKCGTIILVDPRELNERYRKYKENSA